MAETQLPVLLRRGDLGTVGVSRHRLSTLVRDGQYEQIGPGSFIRTGAVDDTTAALMSITARRADATLCLLSALAIHDLTDEIPGASDVALPRGAHRLAVRYAPIAWHFFDQKSFGIGPAEHPLFGCLLIGPLRPEPTLVGVFKFPHPWGTDLATEAVKR